MCHDLQGGLLAAADREAISNFVCEAVLQQSQPIHAAAILSTCPVTCTPFLSPHFQRQIAIGKGTLCFVQVDHLPRPAACCRYVIGVITSTMPPFPPCQPQSDSGSSPAAIASLQQPERSHQLTRLTKWNLSCNCACRCQWCAAIGVGDR